MISVNLVRHSLKSRITFATLIIFLVSLWALAIYTSQMLRKDMQRLLSEQQLSTASLLAFDINQELDDRLRALEDLASRVTPSMLGNTSDLQTFLEDRSILQRLFNGGVIAYRLDGTAIADSLPAGGRIGVNYMDIDVVAVALKGGKTSIGRPVTGKKLGAPVFGMAAPVRDSHGKVIGALAGVVNLGIPNFLNKVAENTYGSTGGYFLVAPQYRLIVTASDRSRVMTALPAPGTNSFIDRFIQGDEGTSVGVSSLGVEVLSSVKRIPVADWNVVVSIPTADAFAPIRDMQQRMLLTTFFLTLLVGGLIWWLLKHEFSPMNAAIEALAIRSDSNQPLQPLPIAREDEIGNLIGSFNSLLETLSQREDALKESEENLAITLHSIGDAVITTDQTGRITRMNPTAQRLSGWTLDAAASRLLPEVFRIIDADTREPMADRMQLVMSQGEAVGRNNHTVLLAKDGREYQIADSAAPIRNAAGAILGVVLVFSDVTEKYQIQLALRRSEERYRELFENAPDGILISDAESYYFDANPCVCQMLGYAREELIGLHASDIVVESEIPYIQLALSQIKAESYYKREWQFRRKDGSVIAAEVTVTTMPDGNLLAIIRDVTARKLAEAALQESKERFLALSTMSSDWFWRQDQQFRFTDFSGAFASDFTPPANTVGKTRWELNIDLTPEQWTAHRAILDAHLPFRNFEYPIADTKGEVRWYSINGEPLFDEAGTFTGYHGTGNNITTRKRAEEKINELAFFDHLTGLPNRTLLMDRLKQTMAASSRSGGHGALLIIDLDNFKTLNDTRGHDMGDMLLKHIAQRLTAGVREGDTVARLGGDEFVVVLAGLSIDEGVTAAAIETVTEKILATLSQPYQLGNVSHHSTASIGVTLFSGDLVTVDDLMKQADLAMYKSKAAGRNVARFFDPTLESAVKERAAMEHDLRRAIVEKQFLLHYQPQVLSGQLTGAEVLVRWQHPQRGLVSPAEFIPLAEETGVILPLGCWVLETACIQLAEWAARPGMAHLTVAVNVSAHQFRHDDFVDQVLTVLKNTGANPQRLKLELTESMLVSNVEEIIEKMLALKAQGVGFSLDDFGTGFSSLSYLKRLPLDQLKIDQSFVRDVLNDPNDASIAKTIIALAQNLGLGVIAEGVETEAQREFLASAGCHAYQGYLFSRPLPLNEFENFVRRV